MKAQHCTDLYLPYGMRTAVTCELSRSHRPLRYRTAAIITYSSHFIFTPPSSEVQPLIVMLFLGDHVTLLYRYVTVCTSAVISSSFCDFFLRFLVYARLLTNHYRRIISVWCLLCSYPEQATRWAHLITPVYHYISQQPLDYLIFPFYVFPQNFCCTGHVW